MRAIGGTTPISSNKMAMERANQSIIRRTEGNGRDWTYPLQ